MRQYIKTHFTDWLLCACIGASMIAAVCSGFVFEDATITNVFLAFLTSLLMQMVLQVVSYRRVFVISGIAAGAFLAVAAVIYMRTTAPFAEGSANESFIFALIAAVTGLLVFLLTRTRAGTVVLFAVGTIVCAGAHFLLFPISMWTVVLFEFSVALMFFCRVYYTSMLKNEMGKVKTGPYMRQMSVIGLATLVLSVGVFYAVVNPLNPPTQELRLITRLKSMYSLEVLGVSSTRTVFDSELASLQNPDMTEFSDQMGEEQNELLEEEVPQTPDEMTLPRDNTSTLGQQILETINYGFDSSRLLWLLVLIPVIVAALLFMRYIIKKRWRRRIQAMPREQAVLRYYAFFISCFDRVGINRNKCQTLREYSENNEMQMQAYSAGDLTFKTLTHVYEKTLYGGAGVSDAEYSQFERYYDSFYKNLRRELGTVKYFAKALRL